MNHFEKNNQDEHKESKVFLDSQKLLKELSEDISRQYWINYETTKKITEFKTESGLDWLKAEIAKSEITEEQKDILTNLWDKKLEKLFFIIKQTKEVIAKSSQNKLDILKAEIDFSPTKSWIENKLQTNIITRIKNPKNLSDNMIWAWIWIAKSWEKILTTAYDLLKWIINLPYDSYLAFTWKAEVEKLKRV